MFWTHWNLSALQSFYGLAASGSETEYIMVELTALDEVILFLTYTRTVYVSPVKKKCSKATMKNKRFGNVQLNLNNPVVINEEQKQF
jgi:hypothetical protein